jgi:hypothetical protein
MHASLAPNPITANSVHVFFNLNASTRKHVDPLPSSGPKIIPHGTFSGMAPQALISSNLAFPFSAPTAFSIKRPTAGACFFHFSALYFLPHHFPLHLYLYSQGMSRVARAFRTTSLKVS